MEVVKNSSDSNHIKLTIKLTSPEWEKVLDKASVKASEGAKIPGFREGKAPRTVVINQIGEARVVSVAIELAVEEYYPLAAKQEQIKPIAFPKIAVEQGGLTEPLTFTAEVAVLPEVKLGDYSKIRVKKTVEPVTDEQVDGVIKNMQKRAVEFQPVEREAKLGDWTEIDFDGFVDGKPFEGGSSKKHPLILGDKVFIPGFEEGMVGMRAQEEKDIEVEFPKDYHNKDLAGKPAKFTVKLHQIKAVNYPDINDTFAEGIALAEYQMGITLSNFDVFTRNGFTNQTKYNAPIITCSDATNFVPVIYFAKGNATKIYMEGSCVIAQAGNHADVIRLKDRLVYGILGIIQ